MKNKVLYIYYFVLVLIMILYTNTSSSPNMIIRLGYLAALVVPLLNYVALYPAIVLCALCISKNTFANPILPTEMQYYVLLSVVFVALSYKNNKNTIAVKGMLVLSLVCVAMNDMITVGEFKPLVTMLFIMILFSICSGADMELSSQFLPLAFIFLSLAISYWLLFCPEASINTYNRLDDMEQTGWRDPNYIACALGTGLVVAVKEILSGRKEKWFQLLMLMTIILSAIALLTVASRGMSLAVSASVSILLLFSNVKNKTKVLSILAIAIFLVLLYTNDYFDFLIARFNMDDGTGSHRTEIWADKITAFFGEGNVLKLFFGFGQSDGFKLGSWGGCSTHNDYVGVLIYYGFVGLALFVSAFLYPVRKCSKKDRPQIAALVLYLMVCSMSIEPFCMGNIAYIGFFFYITQLAKQSRQKALGYA